MEFICFVLFLLLAIYIKLRLPSWKGKYSEKLVHKKILHLPDEYVILNDLLFVNNEHSTQIDHIIVSPYGIFVIETKGYKGWILGGENSEYWTQVIYKNKHQFYNPIKQNEGHIRFLRYLLKSYGGIPFISIVVFNNSAKLKVHVNNYIVVNRRKLNKAITQFHNPILDTKQINWIVTTLQLHCTKANKEEFKQHKRNAKFNQHRTKTLIKQKVCPQCGGQLVVRHGKYGSFYGCQNFPKCKFTMKK